MSRYAIDTIQSREPGVIIKVVFFGYGYKSTWMTTSNGSSTIPNRILDRVIVENLKVKGTLDESIFNEYVTRAEQRIVEKLIQKGKSDNAYERANQHMTDIYDALRAIIVADNLTGALRVQCLNKDKTIVNYDVHKQIVDLEGLRWDVSAEFPSSTVVQHNQTSRQKRPSDGDNLRQRIERVTNQTFDSSLDRETSALSSKNPFIRWWKKHYFTVYSFIFFFALSFTLVYGLLRLQKSIESLPDQPLKPNPTLTTDSLFTIKKLNVATSSAPFANNVTAAKP